MVSPVVFIAFGVLQVVLIFLLAPLTVGLGHFFRARLQGRHGVAPWQYFTHLRSTSRQELVMSQISSWIFKSMPGLSLVCMSILAVILPLVVIGSEYAGLTNFVVVCGLFMLASLAQMLGAMDSGAPLSGLGTSRLLTIMIMLQPTTLLVFVTLALAVGSTELGEIVRIGNEQGQLLLSYPFLALSLGALVLVALAETARYPLDSVNTDLELTMVGRALMQPYSGPLLAVVEYTYALKLTIIALLIANLIWPWPLLTWPVDELAFALLVPVLVLKIVIVMFGCALLEATLARLRFYRLQEYVTGALFIAVSGLVLSLLFAV